MRGERKSSPAADPAAHMFLSPAGPAQCPKRTPAPFPLRLPRFRHRALAPSRRELTDVEASTSRAPINPAAIPRDFLRPPRAAISLFLPLFPFFFKNREHHRERRRSSPTRQTFLVAVYDQRRHLDLASARFLSRRRLATPCPRQVPAPLHLHRAQVPRRRC